MKFFYWNQKTPSTQHEKFFEPDLRDYANLKINLNIQILSDKIY